jgi:hypothetical protein
MTEDVVGKAASFTIMSGAGIRREMITPASDT